MHLLTNPIRDYAWGSTSQMAEFLGTTATGKPQAELWIGAHDGDPSCLDDGRLLNHAITDDPDHILGKRVHDLFGDRLPFLMKVLAVEQPLSLQVHPSGEQARIGHNRESDDGISMDAAHRNYKDPSHKPELIYAITPFEGLAGFREVDKTAALLRLLNLPWADTVADRLSPGPSSQLLQEVVTDTLALHGKTLARLLGDTEIAARHAQARVRREGLRHRARGGGDPLGVNREAIRVFGRVADLAKQYPQDPGVLVTLLLNNVHLAPGESMFVNAGVVHAYLSGFGVEIMASSDNVLRAGLTPKHMDVDELLAITNFVPMPPPRWEASERTDDFAYLEPPVTEFALTVGRTPIRRLPPSGPRVLLVLQGRVQVSTEAQTLNVRHGEAVLIRHDDGHFEIQGDGQVAIGAVPA
ncbi:mannose-6-phosphate isomerase, class I [Nocardioides salsibiostraticola]